MRKTMLFLLVSGVLVYSLSAGMAYADPASGTLFYTTFSGGANVAKVDFNYNGTSFALTNNLNVASTSGADGLLFAPNGNLLVAGQGNNLTEVTTGGTIITAKNPGGPSFHLALTSNASNALVYNLGNGGCGDNCISAVTLVSGGLSANGVNYTVSGAGSHDVRGVIFDPHNSTWYYGTAPDGGSGTFGTVAFNDVAHTATLTPIIVAGTTFFGHGLSFDPFTNDIILNSANTIQQFDPSSGTVVSTLTCCAGISTQFDQAAVDGKGHLFVASNFGNLLFVDYDATGLIGALGNFTAAPFLAGSLDDIAPLSGAGSNPVPEPSTWLLLGSGLAGLAAWRRKKAA